MRGFLLFCCCFLGAAAGAVFGQAPTDLGLSAFYTFDGNLEDATGTSDNAGVIEGFAEFGCGVDATALSFGGDGNFLRIPGGNTNNVNRDFSDADFTVAFYFKPTPGSNATQYLISKRDTNCTVLQFFSIRYAPLTRTVSATLRQQNQEARIDHQLNNDNCWQHVTLTRRENRLRLFINTVEVGEALSRSRVDITNDGELQIGSGNCLNNGEASFTGLIDELRVYNRSLLETEIANLFSGPDRIQVVTDRIFLGQPVDVSLNSPCGVSFQWSPQTGVSDPNIAEPTITPVEAGIQSFIVAIEDAESNCTARDSVVLQVIDPDELDCSQVFLPKAFTPNGIGPTENETFGISNPFAIAELLSFEIYDRYGGRMFQTTDPFARWDGSFNGQPVEPGTAVWRLVFICEGVEEVLSGTVVVLR